MAVLARDGTAAAAENSAQAAKSVAQADVFHQLETLRTIMPAPGESTSAKVVSGQNLTMVWVDVQAGAHRAPHSHPHEQFVWLQSGRMDFRVGDGPVTSCGPNAVLTIPPNVEHEVWYRERCRYVEVFSPVQEFIARLARDQK